MYYYYRPPFYPTTPLTPTPATGGHNPLANLLGGLSGASFGNLLSAPSAIPSNVLSSLPAPPTQAVQRYQALLASPQETQQLVQQAQFQSNSPSAVCLAFNRCPAYCQRQAESAAPGRKITAFLGCSRFARFAGPYLLREVRWPSMSISASLLARMPRIRRCCNSCRSKRWERSRPRPFCTSNASKMLLTKASPLPAAKIAESGLAFVLGIKLFAASQFGKPPHTTTTYFAK